MDTVQHLCAVIGPRPPASRAEREAAAYVHEQIRLLSTHWELINQPFRSISGLRYRIAPLALLAGLSLFTGLSRDRRVQVLSGLFSVGLSVLSRDAFLGRPALWEDWIPHGESQNVIVRIPPRRRTDRRIVLIAHLDSNLHRLSADPRVVNHLPRTLGSITLAALVGGVLTMLSGKKQRWWALRSLIGAGALGGAALAVADEVGAYAPGAIGNASGVAVLLGIARALQTRPANSTEVVLAFTGGGTSVSTGADQLATHFAQPWRDALWTVVSNVGAGELCWVTRHGISPYAYYGPDPSAADVFAQVAQQHPELGLMGKPLLTLDEVAILRDRDLRAVALMGYDRATGNIPHWRQASDTLDAVQPAVLERAAHACWSAIQVVDRAQRWPPPA